MEEIRRRNQAELGELLRELAALVDTLSWLPPGDRAQALLRVRTIVAKLLVVNGALAALAPLVEEGSSANEEAQGGC
jgi:hypothetical protein